MTHHLKPDQFYPGFRILEVTDDFLVGAKGYKLYRLNSTDNRWRPLAKVIDLKNSLLSGNLLTRRFFRAELTRHYSLTDGTQLCIGRKSVFRRGPEDKNFTRCFSVPRGTRPLGICRCRNGFLCFGEYFANRNKGEVHIYGSHDSGKTWEVVFTFPENEINHIHGIFQDPWSDQLWIVTGDLGYECMIAKTTDYFKTLNVLFRGGQEFRTTTLYFYHDHIAFATDSEHIPNRIRYFTRKTLAIRDVCEVQGSVIKGGQCGSLSFFSTAVEKSVVNRSKKCFIWVSKDGLNWKEIFCDKKDFLPLNLFQFGTFEFPDYQMSETQQLYFYGRGLIHTCGKSASVKLDI